MEKKEIKAEIKRLLPTTSRKEIYQSLLEKGADKKTAARCLASTPDMAAAAFHQDKTNILIAGMLLLMAASIVLFLFIGLLDKSADVGVIIGFVVLFSLLFCWGFYKNSLLAYNAYIVIALIQFPGLFEDFMASPIINTIMLAISVFLFALVWILRSKIYPDDDDWFGPKKVNGNYVFTDSQGVSESI